MKSLYIVDYWVPFPQSEYGGVVNLIAGSDSEAFELCADDDQLAIPGYEDRITVSYTHLTLPTKRIV